MERRTLALPGEPDSHHRVESAGSGSGEPGHSGGEGGHSGYSLVKRSDCQGDMPTIQAALKNMDAALEALKRPCAVDLYTDSEYLRGGITGWINNWKRNGWRTKDKKPVKNIDLWQRLDAALGEHRIQWHWVKGHAGHDMNERADQLARDGLVAARAGAIGAMKSK